MTGSRAVKRDVELFRAAGAVLEELARASRSGSAEVPRARLVDAILDAAFRRAVEATGLATPPSDDELARRARDLVASNLDTPSDEGSLGRLYEHLIAQPHTDGAKLHPRRRSGSHYTPTALAEEVTRETLAPILERAGSASEVEALRVCDPAMGTGAFVFAVARVLAEALGVRGVDPRMARRRALLSCVRGVDADPGAVRVAKLASVLFIGDRDAGVVELDPIFFVGDALVGAPGPLEREEEIEAFFASRGGVAPRALDWRAAFPDAFGRRNAGFDAIVGNPPFTGGKRIATTLGTPYSAWLRSLHEGANGNVDLSAHFLRRGFDLLRVGGRLGFITTNTIAQGDTRVGGLAFVCAAGGVITSARSRVEWPGDAAVVVSTVHVEKRASDHSSVSHATLDGRPVSSITAFLGEGSDHGDPGRLESRRNIAFIGCFLRGMGFTFDDGNPEATPVAEMHRIVERNPSARAVLRPYLGGEEVNTSPTHAHHRWVVDLHPLAEEEARERYPELVALLERKVRPFREALGDSGPDRMHKARWWRFANDRVELRKRLAKLDRMFVIPRVSSNLSVVPMPTDVVCSEQLVIVADGGWDVFALLSSRIHEIWARRHSSTLGDGLRYAPSDCFETFPFPHDRESLASMGEALHAHRARTQRELGVGLTALWRRFHDPADQTPPIATLRALHDALDTAVLASYGYSDLRIDVAFREGDGTRRGGPRYTTSPGFTGELLTRLAAENAAQSRRA